MYVYKVLSMIPQKIYRHQVSHHCQHHHSILNSQLKLKKNKLNLTFIIIFRFFINPINPITIIIQAPDQGDEADDAEHDAQVPHHHG